MYLQRFLTTAQGAAYCDCLQRYADQHAWLGFIDVDEFIVLEGRQPAASINSLLQAGPLFSCPASHRSAAACGRNAAPAAQTALGQRQRSAPLTVHTLRAACLLLLAAHCLLPAAPRTSSNAYLQPALRSLRRPVPLLAPAG